MTKQDLPATAPSRIDRRSVLKGAAVAAATGAASMLPSLACADTAKGQPGTSGPSPRDAVIARAGQATVEIATGKIAGSVRNGIFSFKGVPYGETTGGANRFCPPLKPKPWTGLRSSRQYGFVCPQDKGTGRQNDEEAFMFQWNDSVEGEDCLRVNVWTPGINDTKKRPVMVWLHGGGFAAGSGHDLPAFDGENLARRGDVVVVTLNHRLNLLGFLDLSKYAEKYAESGNVGMLDIVQALQWVRENIGVLGGDAQRVLIFGQSGGGAKVSTLMGMPAAQGLFHRAIVQSGSFALSSTPEKSQRLGELMLLQLGLSAGNVDRLQQLPYAELRRASEAVLRMANPPSAGGVIDVRRVGSGLGFGPVMDGKVLPTLPFGPDAPVISAEVPMMIGTTLNEFASGINHPEYEQMSASELESRTESAYPGRGNVVLAAFRKRTPDATPFDIWSRIMSAPVREAAVAQARSKAALQKAPAYLYWFTWHTPIFDGRPRAFHCAELPFVFYNTDRCDSMTGGGPRARALAARIADAWIQFARTGDPNHAGIPQWIPFHADTVPTLMFDDRTVLARNPDGEERGTLRGT
jgi:para-nitrobenzyl esterase